MSNSPPLEKSDTKSVTTRDTEFDILLSKNLTEPELDFIISIVQSNSDLITENETLKEEVVQLREKLSSRRQDQNQDIEVPLASLDSAFLEHIDQLAVDHHEEIKNLMESHRKEIADLNRALDDLQFTHNTLKSAHDNEVTAILATFELERWTLIKDHESLTTDMLATLGAGFEQLRHDFESDQKKGGHNLRNGNSGVKIWAEFRGLPDTSRAVIVAAIGTMSNFFKVTWEFIDWLWPKLITAVAAIQAVIVTYSPVVIDFLNSRQFQRFVQRWERGDNLEVLVAELVAGLGGANGQMLGKLTPLVFTVVKKFIKCC